MIKNKNKHIFKKKKYFSILIIIYKNKIKYWKYRLTQIILIKIANVLDLLSLKLL